MIFLNYGSPDKVAISAKSTISAEFLTGQFLLQAVETSHLGRICSHSPKSYMYIYPNIMGYMWIICGLYFSDSLFFFPARCADRVHTQTYAADQSSGQEIFDPAKRFPCVTSLWCSTLAAGNMHPPSTLSKKMIRRILHHRRVLTLNSPKPNFPALTLPYLPASHPIIADKCSLCLPGFDACNVRFSRSIWPTF